MTEYKDFKSTSKFKKLRPFLTFLLCSLISGVGVFAQHSSEGHVSDDAHHNSNAAHQVVAEHSEEHPEEAFNAGEMILEHISDAHGWHLWGHTEIPLPIIIYNTEKGFSIFSSAKFEHGHAAYGGYKLDHGKIVHANKSDTSSFFDISITKNVASMIISMIILLLILFAVKRAYTKRERQAPKGLQSLLEPLILFMRDEVIKPSVGKHYERFVPLLLTIFFFIFANNLLGLIPLIPGGANVTGNIAITLVLAVIVFIVTQFIAKKDYWRHIFLPDVPKALYPILIPIEILGVFTKPIVLCLRLFANITAGHIIILGFFSLIFIFGQMAPAGGFGASVFSMAFALFMSLLELLVAFLQAYVFTLLSALYFGMALEEHHHEEAH